MVERLKAGTFYNYFQKRKIQKPVNRQSKWMEGTCIRPCGMSEQKGARIFEEHIQKELDSKFTSTGDVQRFVP